MTKGGNMININLKDLNIFGPIVVGVSTGSDSMALFHYLINSYNDKIICAHINHNVRKQSIEEEKFLQNYCLENNIIFESMTIEEYSENNFENEARKKRYEFYEEVLGKYNSKYLFLAHHADDLIETILMKIIRGSNIEGYAGFKRISKKKDYYIVRPFIDYTKLEILEYVRENDITYYEDVTNKDSNYTRNRIRLNIVPLMKKEDVNVHKKFIRYSNTLLEYNNYINDEIDMKIREIYKDNVLDIGKFCNLHSFLQKNVLYNILNNLYGNKDNIIKESHIKNILEVISNSKPNLKINLPKGLVVTKEYNRLIFSFKIKFKEEYKVEVKDSLQIDDYLFEVIGETSEDGNDICRLNYSDVSLPLYFRSRQDGDMMEVLGLNGKKKVKEIFIENKVPMEKRSRFPILIDSKNTILWVPNMKKSKFCIKKDEKCDIILKYNETKEEKDNE